MRVHLVLTQSQNKIPGILKRLREITSRLKDNAEAFWERMTNQALSSSLRVVGIENAFSAQR